MKKILAITLLTSTLSAQALSPNEMLVVIGAVKYYNENCAGLNHTGVKKMNKGLKRFDMHKTPLPVLEQNTLAISGYQTAVKFGCIGTKREAYKAGYGQYIN
ncbi:MAG: hypothetical protein DSZ16_01975 [Candidatus Thioglobus sp.]|nr:MAG: hypothetical protein DSZ13_03680 [Candidatus Thioglobus sp.]RUM82605.1 MAG: hypothetical protein DSZ16_01975 [Candidatus Thioglobus sp.]